MDDTLPTHIHDLFFHAAAAHNGDFGAVDTIRDIGDAIVMHHGAKALGDVAIDLSHWQYRMGEQWQAYFGMKSPGRNLAGFVASCWEMMPAWRQNRDPALMPIRATTRDAAAQFRLMRQLVSFQADASFSFT